MTARPYYTAPMGAVGGGLPTRLAHRARLQCRTEYGRLLALVALRPASDTYADAQSALRDGRLSPWEATDLILASAEYGLT